MKATITRRLMMVRAALKLWLGDQLAQIPTLRGQQMARRCTWLFWRLVRHA